VTLRRRFFNNLSLGMQFATGLARRRQGHMKSKLLVLTVLAGSTLFGQTNFSFDLSFGAPPPLPPAYYYAPPAMPVPGYVWVAGYWYPYAGRWAWRNGYWTRPPYRGGYWVAPRYYGGRYYNGYWGRGDRDHDGIPNRYDRFDNRRGYGYGFRR
jgi:hypothetical protein